MDAPVQSNASVILIIPAVSFNMLVNISPSPPLRHQKTYDNGLPFDGFNNKVYIVIENKSFDDGDEYVIRTIVNHNINLDSNDKAAPTINLEENYYIAHEYEERFKIPNASAFDILSPNVNQND